MNTSKLPADNSTTGPEDKPNSESEQNSAAPIEGSDETGRKLLQSAKVSDIDAPIYVGVPSWNRTYSVNINGEQHFVKAIEGLISTIINTHGGNRQSAIKHIFTAGVQVMAENPSYATNEVRVPLEAALFLANARSRAEFIKELKLISDALGEDELLEMARKANFEIEELFESLERMPDNSSWWEQAERWLVATLQDCTEHSSDEMKNKAIADGIVSDPSKFPEQHEKDWANLKSKASMEGHSRRGKRGFWKARCEDDKVTH